MAHILLIDDEPDLCLLVATELGDDGHSVICAHSLDGADNLLAQNDPDLLILDIRLGRENGLELLHRLRADAQRYIPVILFSSFSAYRHDRVSWQADAYVEKSSDLAPLKHEARRLLARYHSPEGHP